MTTLYIIFSILFIAGVVGYWVASDPLKTLPVIAAYKDKKKK